MAEETNPKSEEAKPKAKKEKKPAVEDKPFTEFMEQDFTPALREAFVKEGIADVELTFAKDTLPIIGASPSEKCWQLSGNFKNGERQFKLYFLDETIKGKKAFSCSTKGFQPSIVESFMIDERRVTLDLMVMYTLQRLNGQKWLIGN